MVLELLAAAQAIYGAVKAGKAANDFASAEKDRKPYKTPEELHKLLQATQFNAQSGFDSATLGFLNNETNRAFSGSLNANMKMGGDANSAASLFDQKLQGIMKIGAQNHALNLENFSKYLGALNTMADSRSAEWSSEQNIVKDRMAAANANKAAAQQNIGNGLNTMISAYAADELSNLGNSKTTKVGGIPLNSGEVATKVSGSGSGYTISNGDLTAPAKSIIKNGIRYDWDMFSKTYVPKIQ